MSLSPVAAIAPNYRDYKGWWLKFYEPSTTTPKTIYTDSAATVSAAKLQLSADGFIVATGGAIVVPYVAGSYDAYIFPTEAEADTNDTSNAVRVADGISTPESSFISQFDNIEDMKSANLSVGDVAMCKRYYAGGDLVDGLVYEIQSPQVTDGCGDHTLTNGNTAILASTPDGEKYGAKISPYDSTPNINALIDATGGVNLGVGTFSYTPSSKTISTVIEGSTASQTKLSVTGSGTVFERSGYSIARNITIDLNGSTYSGVGFHYSSDSPACSDFNVEVKNANASLPAIDFDANGGSQFTSQGSIYHTLGAVGVVASVRVNGTDTSAAPRMFTDVNSSGCTLFDFGGANDFFVSGMWTNNLIFGSNSSKIFISNSRIGGTGTLTVKGGSHTFSSSVSGLPVVLDATAINCNLGDTEVPSWNITDNGTGNRFQSSGTYTPVWGADVNPSLGNGSIIGSITRTGKRVTVDIELTIGSTTTLGTGKWTFSLPFAPYNFSNTCGTALILDSSSSLRYTGVATVELGPDTVAVYQDSSSTPLSPASPIAWAVGDKLTINLSYIAQ